jgi:branched-chain amino acid transport system substrate-binding protein
LLLVGLAVLFGVIGCGTQELAGNRISGHTLTIYASVPLEGSSASGARTVLDGEQLALAQAGGRVGRFTVHLRALDDASLTRDAWDPGQTALNAHLAAADPTTIGYIGELNSGASAVAIPVLNRAGIVSVSPTSTAVGLTSDGPGASPGEPAKYYPTGQRTFVTLAPDDAAQAAAQVQLQLGSGCTRAYVLDDGEFDGYDTAASFQLVARGGGLNVIGAQSFAPGARDYAAVALAVARSGADCVLLSALPGFGVVRLTEQIAAAAPHAQIFATASLAQPSFVDPIEGGIPATLDARVLITAPSTGTGRDDGGFAAAYSQRFGSPGPYAAYGYEAMRLLLSAIDDATAEGHDQARRSSVLKAVFASRISASPLGPFNVQADGATTLRAYSIYQISASGQLQPWTR